MAARAPLRKVGPKLMVILANLDSVNAVRTIRIVKIVTIKKVRMISWIFMDLHGNDHLMSKNMISQRLTIS